MSVRDAILAQFQQVALEQNRDLAPLSGDLPIHSSGLDSLCLAVIIARLEDSLGVDPFTIAEDTPFPVTLNEFIASYEKAVSAQQSASEQPKLKAKS
jgi:hypothetical protein